MDKYQEWGKEFVSERFHEEKKGGYNSPVESNKDAITKENIVKGIKFIIENKSMSQEELHNGLLELGCTFTINDVMKKYNTSIEITRGLCIGDLACGAIIIVNARDSEYSRSVIEERFLSSDDNYSLYHYVRLLTKNYDYTKEYADNLNRKK